jgi:hypothetical protein
MLSELLFIHATGLCALALNTAALAHRCERMLRLQSGLSGLLWAINNLLLGAHTAAAMNLVSAGRTATSAVTLRATPRLRLAVFAGFAVLTLGVGIATWQGWPSSLIVAASLLSTVAVFHLRGQALRLAMLAVSLLWMVNAWQFDSWEQMLANLLTAAAALAGAWRGAASATAGLPTRTATSRPAAAA